MAEEKPRPNLNSDPEYINKIQNLITKKDSIEEIHFKYLNEALTELGITSDIYKDFSLESIPEKTKLSIEKAFEYIENNELSGEAMSKIYRLWDYLTESDTLEKADLIYVFGGISELALREAIRIKNEEYAPKILFSGKYGSYMKDVELSEAEKYANLAIDAGVHEGDIIIEKESINTPENIVNSAKILHEMNFLPNKVIAVSLPYHMKRASLTMKGGFDWEFQLIRHPGLSAKYTRENYFKDKNGWTYICYEFIKLYGARQMGHF